MLDNVLILMLVLSASAQHLRYVKPDDSSNSSCSGDPCFTLHQYTKEATMYFTAGSTFVFLNGNHTALEAVNLINVSNVTLKRSETNSTVETIIICKNEVFVQCQKVVNLTIVGLKFLLSFNKNESYREMSVLKFFHSEDITINSTSFRGSGNLTLGLTRALYIQYSTVTVVNCHFVGNTGYDGGAIHASRRSHVTLNNSIFQENKALVNYGGGGAVFLDFSVLNMNGSILEDNQAKLGGALHVLYSSVTIVNSLFLRSQGDNGGALKAEGSNATLKRSAFIRNSAKEEGGAIDAVAGSVLIVDGSIFEGNGAIIGGAICALEESAVHINGISADELGAIATYCNTWEESNTDYRELVTLVCSSESQYPPGTTFFLSNTATLNGGALYAEHNLTFSGSVIVFKNNSALTGGAVDSDHYVSVGPVDDVNIKAHVIHFENNRAVQKGGAMYISSSGVKFAPSVSARFSGNEAERGGAIMLNRYSRATLNGAIMKFENNLADFGGAIDGDNSDLITNAAIIKFVDNRARRNGGAVRLSGRETLLNPQIKNYADFFASYCEFHGNRAGSDGGAIYIRYLTTHQFSKAVIFSQNTAGIDGGAIYALESSILLKEESNVTFRYNSAQNGGAVYMSNAAYLYFEQPTILNSLHNHASQYGGFMYHEDITVPNQCLLDKMDIRDFPYCFIQFKTLASNILSEVSSHNDTSEDGGDFMYGGLLDRCRLNTQLFYEYNFSSFLHINETLGTAYPITSQPYQLCFCNMDSVDCSGVRSIEIHRGQQFNISLLAMDQMRRSSSATITVKIRRTSSLKINQSSQTLQPNCSSLSYAVFSTEGSEELTLYPGGPCRDTGLARAVINVNLLPCPDGFIQEEGRCVCEKRLRDSEYDADCIVDENIYMLRKTGSKYWIYASYVNGSYEGLIRYKTCPGDYCKDTEVKITLDNPDIQCANNRSGVLCGACRTNYSLMLGSSRCGECSNTYLALLLPFAAAGIALVFFLSVLRLTVATGMINSLILYANIIQVNRELFFQRTNQNIFLSIFIAWLNLDLGIETCFYRGMNSYGQTWLQFAFPTYVWILICLIILVSRYSITVSKLVGHNPIAVLATLLLMSYTKMLKVITDVYSPVYLDYPDRVATAWLKDANIFYFKTQEHRILTVITSLFLVFLFLPYTLLLLLGHKLFRFTGRKNFRWLNRLKPLLDSYYAPYKTHTRYWTGFLLLVRCALYIVFSFNSLGGSGKSLLAIIITFTSIIGFAYAFLGKIYIKSVNNIIEISIYLNLIVLSAITLAELNSALLVHALVGVVFATMAGIMAYHFHILYIAKSASWIKLQTKLLAFIRHFHKSSTPAPVDAPVSASSHDPHRIVTHTVLDLREPLL